ncbi:MAG: RraA family protein [Deinococcus sp.]|nr:RraA family protein [Deinococcus sp.]
MEFIEQQYIDLLKQYDSPTVSNAIELFGVQPPTKGYLPHTVRALFPQLPPMVGYACTGVHRGMTPPEPGEDSGTLVEQARNFATVPVPRVVVIQERDPVLCGAALGDGMALAYCAFGCVGFVTNGIVRDIQGIEPLSFPVFAQGTVSSHAYFRLGNFGQPVEIGGQTIHQGDLIHGDRNGVVVIPNAIAREVAVACPKVRQAEAIVHNYLRSGTVTPEGLAERSEQYLQRSAAIADEVQRELARTRYGTGDTRKE